MDLKSTALATERSTTTRENSNALHSRLGLETASSSRRGAARGEAPATEASAEASEVADRIRLLATAIANREASSSGVRDSAAAHMQALLTNSQMRSDSREAWMAQANVSTRSALALLKD